MSDLDDAVSEGSEGTLAEENPVAESPPVAPSGESALVYGEIFDHDEDGFPVTESISDKRLAQRLLQAGYESLKNRGKAKEESAVPETVPEVEDSSYEAIKRDFEALKSDIEREKSIRIKKTEEERTNQTLLDLDKAVSSIDFVRKIPDNAKDSFRRAVLSRAHNESIAAGGRSYDFEAAARAEADVFGGLLGEERRRELLMSLEDQDEAAPAAGGYRAVPSREPTIEDLENGNVLKMAGEILGVSIDDDD